MGNTDDGNVRPLVEYAPSVWKDYFIKHEASSKSSTLQNMAEKRVEELVREVKNLLANTKDHLQCMELIDALQRLGVGYHFEEEINELLKMIHDHNEIDENNLHDIALKFRLLRQHGYYVTSDCFCKFKENDGEKFKNDLANNVHGLLSLYEACYLGTHEDKILDQALIFAKHHLHISSLERGLKPSLETKVLHALEMPLHRRIPRVEARQYIAIYEQDNELRNDLVLELAKLDFNLLQILHQQEAKIVSMWCEGIGPERNYSFARDRIIACYFWSLSVYFEPKYSKARCITTKVLALMSITDDIYDAYGTLDELQSFTQVIKRWDVDAAHRLKNYLKVHFHNIHNTFEEFAKELTSCGKPYRIDYLRQIFKVVASAWLEEAKWRDEAYIPSLKEYLQVATVTTCYNLATCASFIGMDDIATKETFDWVLAFPKFTYHQSLISRIKNDITSHTFEQTRNHVASVVQCYMKEKDTTIEMTYDKLLGMVEDEWKCLNKEYFTLMGTFSRDILIRVINFARFMETTYDA